jgi:drug/metabolite transporter (DMT)-like permease
MALVLAAYVAIYLIWGSTFLGMRLAIDSIPPLLMAGGRFIIAGVLLYSVMRWRGDVAPNRRQWLNAIIIGAMLVTAGNGGVCWAQQTVPTSIAALIVASVPLWIMLADWWRPNGLRPALTTVLGLIAGFIGVGMIVLSKDDQGTRLVDPLGAGVLLTGNICWALGSIYSRQTKVKAPSPLLGVGMQMIAGGVLDVTIGLLLGEGRDFHPDQITAVSAWAFVYLTFVGSLVAYTAYVWLLTVSSTAKVSTYAYVNPVIAVMLGHVGLKEALPHSLALAGLLILVAVVLITRNPVKPPLPRGESR